MFSWSAMPDQFALESFRRLELDRPGRGPVMAEIDLITSHAPWSRVPWLIDQAAVGDGSVFEGDCQPGVGGDSRRLRHWDTQL